MTAALAVLGVFFIIGMYNSAMRSKEAVRRELLATKLDPSRESTPWHERIADQHAEMRKESARDA